MYVINQWGFFISRKLGKPFFPIPRPKGYEKSRLLDAYFEKVSKKGVTNESDPILPGQLKSTKANFKKEHHNWLYLSVWLGLRPKEIDQLKDSKNFRIHHGPDGTSVLWVYQTKLTSVPPKYRWKLIPLIFEEQKKIQRLIKSKKFHRPLVKTVKLYLGKHTTL